MSFALLIAQDTAEKSGGGLASLLPLVLIGAAMYFLLLRPQRKRMKAAQDLVKQISEGDEIITTGGIYGFVNAIDGDVFWLDIADNVEIRVHRSAIARKIDPKVEPAGGEPATPGATSNDSTADDSADDK